MYRILDLTLGEYLTVHRVRVVIEKSISNVHDSYETYESFEQVVLFKTIQEAEHRLNRLPISYKFKHRHKEQFEIEEVPDV